MAPTSCCSTRSTWRGCSQHWGAASGPPPACRELHTGRLDSGGAGRQPARQEEATLPGGNHEACGVGRRRGRAGVELCGPGVRAEPADRRRRQDGDGLRLRPGDPRARLHPERAGRRSRRRRGSLSDRDHAPARVEPDDEGPGDRRAEPVLHVGLRAVRRRVHRRPRRRRRQRPLAALVRQLLRPARLRGDPGRDGRHRQLDRLRHQRRPGGCALHQGRDRLAQRARCPATAPRPAPPTRCSPPGTPARRR